MKTKQKKSATIPQEITKVIESEIDLLGAEANRDLSCEVKRSYVYVYAEDKPLCRLGYTGNYGEWKFAIFKWSTETYSSSEFGFLPQGTIRECIFAAIDAYPKTELRLPFLKVFMRLLAIMVILLLRGIRQKLSSLKGHNNKLKGRA